MRVNNHNRVSTYRKPTGMGSRRTSLSESAKARRAERYAKFCKPAGTTVEHEFDPYSTQKPGQSNITNKVERCNYCGKEVARCYAFGHGLAMPPAQSNLVAHRIAGSIPANGESVSHLFGIMSEDRIPPRMIVTGRPAAPVASAKSSVATKAVAQTAPTSTAVASKPAQNAAQPQTTKKGRWAPPVFNMEATLAFLQNRANG